MQNGSRRSKCLPSGLFSVQQELYEDDQTCLLQKLSNASSYSVSCWLPVFEYAALLTTPLGGSWWHGDAT